MRGNVYMITNEIYGFKRTCHHCGEESQFGINYEEYQRLFIKQEHVQDVFPNMPKEDRELMISGIHPKCWIEMFEDFDEDEEEDNGDSETQGEEYGEQ
jgi:hypothetical protein